MRVQLIHPPMYVQASGFKSVRPGPPLGLAYIASTLRAAGHEVSLLDAIGEAPDRLRPVRSFHALGLDLDGILERVDARADALALSLTWSFSWPLIRPIARALKERHPDKWLIAGGEHVTGLPELTLSEAPFDAAVLGEGEETAAELFAALEDERPELGSIEGIAYRRGEEIVRTPRRSRTRDVDAIPWPAWDLVDLEAYHRHKMTLTMDNGLTVPILATRGCPYACTYCSSPSMWTRLWKPRDPRDVVDEIEHYHRRYGARNFPFQDLTAVLKRQWILDFCRELDTRGLDLTWHLPAGTRCEVVDDEVAMWFRRTGGRSTAFAPESGSARTRKLVDKRMKEETVIEAVRAATRNDLSICIFLIVGFPKDTWADVRESARMARRLALAGADDVGIGTFFPLPGTELYRELEAAGRIRLDDEFLMLPLAAASDFRGAERQNYCEALSARQLALARWWVTLQFYAVAYATRPWKVLQILANAARGRETRRMEAMLVDLRARLGARLRRGAASA